jgi:hypothetical protein
MIEPIINFSRSVGFKPTFWFFPYLVNDYVAQMIITFGAVILFCDAPFHSPMEKYLLIRTNYRFWNAGQAMYILCASFFYLAFIVLSTLLVLLMGCGIEWSDGWGKIWGTLANTNARQQFTIPMRFDLYLYSHYSPKDAFLYSFILEWSAISLIGLVSYNINRIKLHIGTIFTAMLTLLDLAIANDLPFALYKISPISLAKLSVLTGNSRTKAPTMKYAIIFFAATIVIGTIIAIWNPNKKKNYKILRSKTKGKENDKQLHFSV